MRRPHIAVVNESDLADDEVAKTIPAFQKQVNDHFQKYWGRGCHLKFEPDKVVPTGAWLIVVVNDADQAGALGYHDITAEDLPLGKVFVKTSEQDGVSWTSVFSHELLEILGDPQINLLADMGSNEEYIYEACDPVEGDSYMIGDVEVSNFVTPKWFEDNGNIGPWDYLQKTTKPLQLTPGGYQYIKRGSQYTPVFADRVNMARAENPPKGSRRERRMRGRKEWQRSSH
jgi:hypothetical protein